MLKVLYLPIGSQPGTEQGWRDVGVNLKIFDFVTVGNNSGKNVVNAQFLQSVRIFKPDLIHMQLQMTGLIDPATILEAKKIVPNAVITNWTGDVRTRPSGYFIQISKVVDFSLMSNIGQIELYKKNGCQNAYYWQIGYDPKICYPHNNKSFKYSVSFAANTYKKTLFPDVQLRWDIANMLRKRYGVKFGLFGSGYPAEWNAQSVAFNQVNNVYNDSACVLGVSNFNDISHYFSDRTLMCVGSGRPTISYRFPGIKSYFDDKSEILVANHMSEIPDLVDFCVNNPDAANKIGLNGNRRCLSEHTFKSRIIELLTLTNLIGKL